METTDPILAILDEMDAAAERAAKARRDRSMSLGERLDLSRGWDHAAANRFQAVALAYRKLHDAHSRLQDDLSEAQGYCEELSRENQKLRTTRAA